MFVDNITAAISFLLNLVHMAVLIKFYKNNNNSVILLNLAFSDLLRATTILLTSNCPAQMFLLENVALCRVSTIVNDGTLALNLAILTMAGIDRYIAVCRPFEYLECSFTRHFTKIMVTVWTVIALDITFQNGYLMEACVIGSKMCVVFTKEPIYILYIAQAFLLCATSLTVICICFVQIIKEFLSMAKHQQAGVSDTRKLSIVVGTITVLFYLLYLPLFSGVMSIMAYQWIGRKTWIYLYSLLTIHGIVNAVTYGWQKKSYRRHVRSIFCGKNVVDIEGRTRETAAMTTSSAVSKANEPT